MPTTASDSDPGADLARWVATGDRSALDRALAAAADPAYAQALRLLGRAADADDATQEALVQLARSARRYDPSRPFRPWLARLVHDACCRLLRSDRRRRRHEAEAAVPLPAEQPIDAEAVRAAVLDLPESLRSAVELHYFAGLSQAEAAESLGIGEGACAMRLNRARERLRGLLQRRGVGAASAAALAVLAAAPAHAAPPGLAAGIAAQAAAGTLPATTIPLTTLQTGAWFMATHPIAATLIAVGIGAVAVTPLAMTAGEGQSPQPVPVVAPAPSATGAWSGPAQALLPFLDPAAPFRLAIDLETLRSHMLKVKPFSLLADPRMTAAVAVGRKNLQQTLESLNDESRFDAEMAVGMALEGRGLSYAIRDASAGRMAEQRMLMAMDAGTAAPRLLAHWNARLAWKRKMIEAVLAAEGKRLGRQLPMPEEKALPPPIGPFTCTMKEETIFIGNDGSRFVFADPTWLAERVAAAPATPPPAAAWFRFDAASLIAGYAAAAGPTGDPARVADVLGPRWRTLKPVIEGTVGTQGDEITASVRVTGAAPFSPLVPLTLLVGGTGALPFGNFAAWPMRKPAIDVPASPDRVASLAIGLTPPQAMQPFTKAVTEWEQSSQTMARDLVVRMLALAWSGDLALELRPGAPLPKGAMVIGLRSGTDAAEAARQIAVWLNIPQDGLDRPGKLPKSIAGIVAGGQLAITALADRLVVTWNADMAEWPGIASAAAPATAPACAITVDLPMAARTWWPLAVMATPQAQRGMLPPLPVLMAHLPVWRMQWEATPEGCHIEERGLPMAAILTAAASLRTAIDADPVSESRRGHLAPAPVQRPATTNDF